MAKAKTVTPVDPEEVHDPNLVDIRDEDHHLLFRYDPLTDSVEIKARGKLYRINVGELRFVLKRNVISDAPVTVFDLQPVHPQDVPGQVLPDNPLPDTFSPVATLLEASGSATAPDLTVKP